MILARLVQDLVEAIAVLNVQIEPNEFARLRIPFGSHGMHGDELHHLACAGPRCLAPVTAMVLEKRSCV